MRESLVEDVGSSCLIKYRTEAPFTDSVVQFLEPKYGYFHCKDCKTRWESAYVWCISGTNKVSERGSG